MQLIKARTIHVPTHVVLDSGVKVYVEQDDHTDNPIEGFKNEEHFVFAYRKGPWGRHHDEIKYPLQDAWMRLYETFGGQNYKDTLAREVFRRYLNVFYPHLEVDFQIVRGYSQSEWQDVVAVVNKDHGYGSAQSNIDLYQQWFRGDVYYVHTSDDQAVSGIYADDEKAAIVEFLDYYYEEN